MVEQNAVGNLELGTNFEVDNLEACTKSGVDLEVYIDTGVELETYTESEVELEAYIESGVDLEACTVPEVCTDLEVAPQAEFD